jgi:hypothetical protein
MTDVEFSNLLSELNKSASELNAGTGVTPVEWTAEGLRLTVLRSDSFRS